jgi:hypothetical protein
MSKVGEFEVGEVFSCKQTRADFVIADVNEFESYAIVNLTEGEMI